MGRVRTKTIKRAARLIVEKYYFKLTPDFQINKKITKEVAVISSKRTRNKVAGFVTHLMKRIEKAPVPGISLKIQEDERERRFDYTPEISEYDVSGPIQLDADGESLVKDLNIQILLEKPGKGSNPQGHA